MIGNDVDDDVKSQVVGLFDEGVEVLERAEQRVDADVVADVVSVVEPRGRKEGRHPQRIDAEPREVFEA